ncbi:NADAR family protein [Polyangium aurulentum]|uniref:NADAR family protein n=1 Tax=Polyangium aurulentum TaxID=2567896 RepID=UPI0010AE4F9C|nr:NADAR family protein [Polyangium aurulentum]UQA60122.1 NADAR family protein [Polyangium aurulentum]
MDKGTLIAASQRGEPLDYLFFWGHTAAEGGGVGPWVLSQWWLSSFEVEGQTYPATEHFMMAEKARLFGDDEVRARILATGDPAKAKKLGREVRGFDEARWAEHRYSIVVQGNLAKFGQSDKLRSYLRSTGKRVLVEASPQDRIWGIGLAAADPRARQPAEWPGLNLLGFALMEVRARLGGAD